jgi:ribosomal protein S18 acetylase RimI-like enzyme
MRIALRPAVTEDFEYCRGVYFAGMNSILEELNLDRTAHADGFRQQWVLAQVQIITLDGCDVGWLQSKTQDDKLFVAQLFVDVPFQRRGIGTKILNRLIAEATGVRHSVSLAVVKTNPAVKLYERLGFHITHEDDRKFYMKRDAE